MCPNSDTLLILTDYFPLHNRHTPPLRWVGAIVLLCFPTGVLDFEQHRRRVSESDPERVG